MSTACGPGNSSRQVDTQTMMTLRAVVLRAVSATGDDIRLSDTRLPLHSAMACSINPGLSSNRMCMKLLTYAQEQNTQSALTAQHSSCISPASAGTLSGVDTTAHAGLADCRTTVIWTRSILPDENVPIQALLLLLSITLGVITEAAHCHVCISTPSTQHTRHATTTTVMTAVAPENTMLARCGIVMHSAWRGCGGTAALLSGH